MTNDNHHEGQHPEAEGFQRGPSFEDPMRPPPPQPSPVPDQTRNPAWATDAPAAPSWDGQPQQEPNPYATPLYGQDPYAMPPSLYQQPYGASGGYGMYSHGGPVKSKNAAAVLAFFLGGAGGHSFYLGKTALGVIHLVLGIGGIVLMVVAGTAMETATGSKEVVTAFMVLLGLGAWLGNGVWAFVEFIIILIKPENELGR